MEKNAGLRAISLMLLIFSHINSSNGARILAASFMSSKSHMIAYEPLLEELAKRGHEVTVLSPILSKSNSTNPRQILTFDMDLFLEHMPDMFDMKLKGETQNPFVMIDAFDQFCRKTYALPQVMALLDEKFDLIIHEPFMNECTAGYIHKFNTSLILMSTMSIPSEVVRELGNPSPPSFIPNTFTKFENKMNFYERAINLFTELMLTGIQRLYFTPKMEALYREVLNDPNLPGVQDLIRNASLAFSVSHFSLSGSRPFMPDVIEIGGMHMHAPKPLPKV
jgi:glucuronosyltransferase